MAHLLWLGLLAENAMLEVYTMEEVIGRMCCFDSGRRSICRVA
jgi:hypothetical protein